MTPQELEDLVLLSNEQLQMSLLQQRFAGMPEMERSELAKFAQDVFSQMRDFNASENASQQLHAYIDALISQGLGPPGMPSSCRAISCAVLATSPLSWATRRDLCVTTRSDDIAWFLRDRAPEWLTQWVDAHFKGEWFSHQIKAGTVREWIRDGICQKPSEDGFFASLANELVWSGRHSGAAIEGLVRQFVAQPDLIEYVPDFFRVDCSAFKREQHNPYGTDGPENLPHALVALCERGYLDRSELISMAYEGLASEKLLRNSKSGLIEFLNLLAVTPAEKAAWQDRLFELLSSPIPHVRKFAIDEIAMLDKEALLETDTALREVPMIFTQEGKGTSVTALKLLDRIAKRFAKQEASPALALDAIAEGMRHAHCDVQAQAISLLQTHANALSAAQWETIDRFSDFIDQTKRADLDSLLAMSGKMSPQSRAEPVASASYAPTNFEILACRVLFDENRITPITDLDELIDTILRCLEYVDTPDDIERIIDGISRLADQRPPDFERRIAPLRKRIEDEHWTGNGLTAVQQLIVEYPSDAAAQLVRIWIGMVKPTNLEAPYEAADYHPFLTLKAHLKCLYLDVLNKRASPLLSCPTHRGGWIDPVEWVERLGERSYAKLDVLRSLARLAPDNRAAALTKARTLQGEVGSIARFALGDDEAPNGLGIDDYDLLITAARCRDPMRDWSDLATGLSIEDPWPGGAMSAVYYPHIAAFKWGDRGDVAVHFKALNEEWNAEKRDWEPNSPRHPLANGGGSMAESLEKARLIEMRPFAALHSYPEEARGWALGILWVQQWLGYQCPLDPRPCYLKGAKLVYDGIDDRNPELRGMFEVLLCPSRPWGEEAYALAIMGLLARETEACGLAVDAVIAAIDRYAFDPHIFATVIRNFCVVEWMKLNRFAAALSRVVAVSPMHAAAISSALQVWLTDFDFSRRGAHELLSVVDQAHATMTMAISDEFADKLAQLKGSNKVAKLASSILARTKLAA